MPAMPRSRSIPGLLDELAARFPKREALVGGGRRYTYAALRDEVRAFAKGLHALARISHTIFARSSKVERGFVSFRGDVLARGVGRRERELGFFRSCGCSEQFDLSVGLG